MVVFHFSSKTMSNGPCSSMTLCKDCKILCAYLCVCCADDIIASLGKIYSPWSWDETWSVRPIRCSTWVQGSTKWPEWRNRVFMLSICCKDIYAKLPDANQVFRSGAGWTFLLSFHGTLVNVHPSGINVFTVHFKMTFEYIDWRSPAFP